MTRRAALRASFAYALATGLQRALAFLLLPFFTRAVSPAEYGQLSLAVSITGIATILFAGGLEVAVLRTHFQLSEDPEGQQRHIRTVWTALLVAPILIALIVTAAAWPFLEGASVVSSENLGLALIAAALSVGGTVVPFAILRSEQRLREYLAIGVTLAVSTTVGTVLLVVVLGLGITAWLAAIVAANALTLVVALWVTPFPLRAGFDRAMLLGSVRFSLPLLPHFVSQWALRVADQFLLATMVVISQVGIYSLAASIAAPAGILLSTLNGGFMPSYAAAGKSSHRRRALADVVDLQLVLVMLITLAAACLGPAVVHLLASPRYGDAAELAPWLILGYGLLGAYYVPLSISILTHDRRWGVPVVTTIGAVVNIVAVLALVPPFGLTGAAAATPLGYGVLLAGLCFYVRDSDVRVPWPKILAVAAICGLAYLGAVWMTGAPTTVGDAVVRGAWVALAVAGVALSSRELRTKAAGLARSRFGGGALITDDPST
jgi:O-antigen/teichoic acid export membrane protein